MRRIGALAMALLLGASILTECETPCIEPLSAEYTDQYIDMHSKDVYWTGEKVIKASDRFKTFVAIEDGAMIGISVD